MTDAEALNEFIQAGKTKPNLKGVEMSAVKVPLVFYTAERERLVVGEATVFEDYSIEASLNDNTDFDSQNALFSHITETSVMRMSFNFNIAGEVALDFVDPE